MKNIYSFLLGTMMLFALVVPVQAEENPVIIVQDGATINYYGTQTEPVAEPEVPAEEMLGITTRDDLVINEYLYFNLVDSTTAGIGFRWDGSELQSKTTVAGSWGSISGATPGDEGWLANSINNAMYPATNADGTYYPIMLGVSATSSPATVNTELFVGGGGGIVATGALTIGGATELNGGAFTFNEAGADLNVRFESDDDAYALVIDGGDDNVGIGLTDPDTKLEVLKAGTQVKLSYDGTYYATFAVGSAGDLTIVPSGGDLLVTGTSTPSLGLVVGTDMLVVNAVTDAVGINVADPDSGLEILHTTAPLKLSYDGSNACTFVVSSSGDGTYTCSGGDISFTNENLVTTGNIGGANATFSGTMTGTGDLAVDTDTLYVDASADSVGIATTTPNTSYVLDVYGDFRIGEATNADAFVIDALTGVLTINTQGTATADLTIEGDSVEDLFVTDASANQIGIGTSTPAYLLDVDGDVRIGEATNADAFVINAGTGVVKFNEQGTATADFTIEGDTETDLFSVDASEDKVGIASSTPFGLLGIGDGGTATSTLSMGKFCMYAGQENGTAVYVILGANQANGQPFATTTVSCF